MGYGLPPRHPGYRPELADEPPEAFGTILFGPLEPAEVKRRAAILADAAQAAADRLPRKKMATQEDIDELVGDAWAYVGWVQGWPLQLTPKMVRGDAARLAGRTAWRHLLIWVGTGLLSQMLQAGAVPSGALPIGDLAYPGAGDLAHPDRHLPRTLIRRDSTDRWQADVGESGSADPSVAGMTATSEASFRKRLSVERVAANETETGDLTLWALDEVLPRGRKPAYADFTVTITLTDTGQQITRYTPLLVQVRRKIQDGLRRDMRRVRRAHAALGGEPLADGLMVSFAHLLAEHVAKALGPDAGDVPARVEQTARKLEDTARKGVTNPGYRRELTRWLQGQPPEDDDRRRHAREKLRDLRRHCCRAALAHLPPDAVGRLAALASLPVDESDAQHHLAAARSRVCGYAAGLLGAAADEDLSWSAIILSLTGKSAKAGQTGNWEGSWRQDAFRLSAVLVACTAAVTVLCAESDRGLRCPGTRPKGST